MNQESSIRVVTRGSVRLAALATLFAMAACGGGGGANAPTPPPPPPPDPTVSAMFVNPASLGNLQELMVTIQGTDLGQGLSVTSPQCTSLTRNDASPNASSAATAYYRCAVAPAAATGTVVKVDALLSKDNSALGTASFTIGATTMVATALAGEGAMPPDENGSAVAGQAKYGQLMTVAIAGENVNQGLAFESFVCLGMFLSTTPPLVSTPARAYYRCRVTATNLSLNLLAVKRPGTVSGDDLVVPQFNVPAPQVRLRMATVDPSNQRKAVLGDVLLTLAPNDAPKTSNNFLDYVNSGFYDGTIFHFVSTQANLPLIIGGRYNTTTGTPPPTPKAASLPGAAPEPGGTYAKGSVAMTLGTVQEPGLAQISISTLANTHTGSSMAFATISEGQALVDSIAGACGQNVCQYPVPNFTIESAVQIR